MLMDPRLYLHVGSAKRPNLLTQILFPNLCKGNYLLVICPSTRFKSIVYGQRWIIWCHSKFYDIPFFSLTDCEWLYKVQLKGGTLLPPSDAYVRSFLYLLYTLLHKSSERSSLVSGPGLNSSPPEAKNPVSATTFQLDLLAVQGILKSLLQHHSSKASILWAQLSL